MGIVLDTPSLFPTDHGVPGGTFVIHGVGFVTFPVTRVWFSITHGGLEYVSASFVVTSDTRLTVTIPSPGGPGHFLEGYGIIISTLVPPFDIPGDAGADGAVTELWTVDDPGQPPFLTSLTPSTAAPGEVIAILGGGFSGSSVVTFNGVNATRRTVVDSTHIIAEVPPGTPGDLSGDLIVTNLHGPSDAGTTFTAIYRSLGLLYDEQLMAVPNLSLGPMVDEQLQGVPFLSLGPMIDEVLVGSDELSSALDLTSSVVDSQSNLGAIDSTLTLVGSESDNVEYGIAISSALDLVSTIAAPAEWFEDLESMLGLTQLAQLVWPFTISSALDLAQDAVVTWPEAVTSDLSVLQAIVDALSTLVLTDAAFDGAIIDGAEYNDSVGSAFDLSQLATSTMVKPGTPTGVSECDASYLTFAPISLQKTVTFSWDILSVTIKAPEFDNDYATDTRALVRKNRGGEPRIQRPSSWVIIKTLKMRFTGLSVKDVNDFIHLLSRSAGREITLLDHENVTWVGVVTNQTIDVIETVGACANEVDIEFRGVRS